jgi:hypothetical protein
MKRASTAFVVLVFVLAGGALAAAQDPMIGVNVVL